MTRTPVLKLLLGTLAVATAMSGPTAPVAHGEGAFAWKGAESMSLVALAPAPERCGEPPVLEARFAGDGIDNAGGIFAVTASACIDPTTLRVTDLEATDTFRDGALLIEPADTTLVLDPATCIATNPAPVPFGVGGGTGRYAGATGSGTYHLAVNWAPCNGLNVPARVWFQGTLVTS